MKYIFLSLLFFFSKAHSVTYSECTTKITEVLAGPMYNSMIRLENRSCGTDGWICIHPNLGNENEVIVSDRVFSVGLAAKAVGAEVLVRWRTDANGCNGPFPKVHDLRIR